MGKALSYTTVTVVWGSPQVRAAVRFVPQGYWPDAVSYAELDLYPVVGTSDHRRATVTALREAADLLEQQL